MNIGVDMGMHKFLQKIFCLESKLMGVFGKFLSLYFLAKKHLYFKWKTWAQTRMYFQFWGHQGFFWPLFWVRALEITHTISAPYNPIVYILVQFWITFDWKDVNILQNNIFQRIKFFKKRLFKNNLLGGGQIRILNRSWNLGTRSGPTRPDP